jgi:hypothetical protein
MQALTVNEKGFGSKTKAFNYRKNFSKFNETGRLPFHV